LAENEELKRQLKGTRTQISNLRGELRHVRQWHESEMSKTGGIPFAARSKIGRALHPEHNPTRDELTDAFKAWSQIISDQRKAGHRER
jgi:hypothetical protein